MNEVQKANKYIEENRQKIVETFRNKYHLMAPVGWINDPNGFVYFRGEYHLFYQFYPYDSVWGPMHWGHAKSKDLINWEELPVALAPSEAYDIDGCFSGTAVVKDDKLYLFYTGHVENSQIKREVQCMAVSEDGIHFEKYKNNPLIDESHIQGIASYEDFRDPKIFEKDSKYYMLVASQTEDLRGQILMFVSENMLEWQFNSILLEGNETQGIMWECPDVFELDGKDVLIMSPIQMPKEGYKYANRSSTVAFIGEIDWTNGKLKVDNYHEIDSGLDFYAPQTCENSKGNRYLMAWMQMWDRNMPTNDLKHGWAGSMTLPRRLFLENNYLKQEPVMFSKEEVELHVKLSNQELTSESNLIQKINSVNYILIEVEPQNGGQVAINYGIENAGSFELIYEVDDELLTINRESIGYSIKGAESPILNSRSLSVPLKDGKLALKLFGDRSSLEIFTHDGQTLTTTFFEEQEINQLIIKTDSFVKVNELVIYKIITD